MKRHKRVYQPILTHKYTAVIYDAPKSTVAIHNVSLDGYNALIVHCDKLGYSAEIDVHKSVLDYQIMMHVLSIRLYA